MIAIRSVTYNMPEQITPAVLNVVENCSGMWDSAYGDVHTQRMNLVPFTQPFSASEFTDISNLCERSSIRWFNVPVNLNKAEKPEAVVSSLVQLLKGNGRAFGNLIGVEDSKINTRNFEIYAQYAKDISRMHISGKDNFRAGLSFNIGYNCPFFPFTRSSGELSFSIALEMAKDMNDVCRNTEHSGLADLREKLIDRLLPQIQNIYAIAQQVSRRSGIPFAGFDFSLAPSIDEMGSVITILHAIGVYNFGRSGTMFATSFLTDILKHFAAIFPSVGFSGVMYSLLEDLELCKINNKRGISIEQLTMVSTMCGCGLDMVPVYGEISDTEVAALCYEIAAISCKLNKPLGVRLLPIQHCKRGTQGYTAMKNDADFVANTKVVHLDVNVLDMEDETFSYLALPYTKN